MTMIIAAHLEDCILIAADKRAMTCDLETGVLRLAHDEEQKIKLWRRGAIAGTGETEFINRIAEYFIHFEEDGRPFKQMDVIYETLEKRILEGIPKKVLINNSLIFSMFNGVETLLYLIPIEPFFKEIEKNGQKVIQPQLHQIKPYAVDVTCFNMPPDMSNLQNFQRNLRSLSSFEDELDFIEYYTQQLKQVFGKHAQIDPSITTSFDLYIQSCNNGESLAMHIANTQIGMSIPKKLNYWNKTGK